MKIVFVLLFATSFCLSLYGQDTNPLKTNNLQKLNDSTYYWRIGVSAGLSHFNDAGLIGVINGEFNITPKISAGFTYCNSFDVIDKYFCFSLKYWKRNNYYQRGFYPSTGISVGRNWFILGGDKDQYDFIEIPLVANYGFKSGLQASIQLDYYIIFLHPTINTRIIQTPIGISYTSKFGLYTSLSFSYFYEMGYSHLGPNVYLKLGWRFNFRKRGNRL